MVQETARINFEATNLDVVEGRIKAIGGAINVLGGSIEVVVGTMGLIGIDEKVTKQFQEAATSAIAFADGAKRVFEGYKELREASQLFRKAQEAATIATAANTTATAANNTVQASSVGILGKVRAGFIALNAAISANPFTAAAIALGTLVAALVAYSYSEDDATDKTDDMNKSLEEQKNLTDKINSNLDLRRRLFLAQGGNPVVQAERDIADANKELDKALKSINKEEVLRQKLLNAGWKTTDAQIVALDTRVAKFTEDELQARIKIAEANKVITEAYEKASKGGKPAKTPMEKFREELSALSNKFDQEEALLLKRKLLGEKVDDEILKSQNDRFDASIKLMKKYNIFDKNIIQQELDRRTKAEEDKTRIQNQEEEKRKANIDKAFQFMIQGVDKHYKQQLTLLRKQNLTKEEFEEKSRQLENDRLNNQLALHKLYGKDVTDILAQIAANNQQFTETSVSNLTDFFNSELAKQVSGVLSAVNSITSGMLQMAESDSEARLNTIEAEYNARMEGLVGTDEEIAAQQEAIEAEKNREMEAERRRAFEDQKKLKIADTITSGMAAAFEAFASAMQLGPILGPIVGAALSAMILTQMGKTVQNLQRQQYIGSSSGGAGGGGMGASGVGGYNMSNAGGGFSGAGAPMTGGSSGGAFGGGNMSAPNPQNNTLPVRAYVVASDVSNGLDAQADIDSRRTL